SVMLGVATLIVVNAVMSGFSTKLKDRLHGVLSDVVVDTDRMDGFPEPAELMRQKILQSPAGERVEAIAPTVEVFAILQFNFRGRAITKPVRLIGIDPKKRAAVGGFAEYLVNNGATPEKAFDLTPEALQRHDWNMRRIEAENALQLPDPLAVPKVKPLVPDPNALPPPTLGIRNATPEGQHLA